MAPPVSLFIDHFSKNHLLTPVPGVVHAVSYSLLLLNTDLHVAELSTRMSRNQFVRNTLAAIQTQLQSPPPLSEVSATDLTYDDCGSIRGSDVTETAVATPATRTNRSGSVTSWNSTTRDILPVPIPGISSAASPARPTNGSTPSIQISLIQETKNLSSSGTSSVSYGRNWENEMESLLKVRNHVTVRSMCLIFCLSKEMYNAIKSQQILQPLGSGIPTRSSMSSLSPGPPGLHRKQSLRGSHDRLATLKRGSIRGLQSVLNAPPGSSPYSSNSSIDGRVSPSPSFATSTHEVILSAVYLFVSCLHIWKTRLCTDPTRPSSHLRSVLLRISPIPLSERLKRMTTAFAVRIQLRRQSVSQTKNWHFSVLPGPRRACYVASNTGSRLGREPRTRAGWTSSS